MKNKKKLSTKAQFYIGMLNMIATASSSAFLGIAINKGKLEEIIL